VSRLKLLVRGAYNRHQTLLRRRKQTSPDSKSSERVDRRGRPVIRRKPITRPKLPRRWEEEVYFRAPGLVIGNHAATGLPPEGIGRAEIRENRREGDLLKRPKLPQKVWLRSTRVLWIHSLLRSQQINYGVARLLVTCFLISEKMCTKVHRRFVEDVRQLVSLQRGYFKDWHRINPHDFHVIRGRMVVKVNHSPPHQLINEKGMVPGSSRYRDLMARRFPAKLGILCRLNYAQLCKLLAANWSK